MSSDYVQELAEALQVPPAQWEHLQRIPGAWQLVRRHVSPQPLRLLVRPLPRDPRYLIGACGTVWSTKGKGACRRLRPSAIANGYITVQGRIARRRARHYVHQLVLETFRGPRPIPRHVARHADDNRANNALHNLHWGTKSDNWHDAVRNRRASYGSAHPTAKLDEPTVACLRWDRARGKRYTDIARIWGIPLTTVYEACTGATWRHVRWQFVDGKLLRTTPAYQPLGTAAPPA